MKKKQSMFQLKTLETKHMAARRHFQNSPQICRLCTELSTKLPQDLCIQVLHGKLVKCRLPEKEHLRVLKDVCRHFLKYLQNCKTSKSLRVKLSQRSLLFNPRTQQASSNLSSSSFSVWPSSRIPENADLTQAKPRLHLI